MRFDLRREPVFLPKIRLVFFYKRQDDDQRDGEHGAQNPENSDGRSESDEEVFENTKHRTSQEGDDCVFAQKRTDSGNAECVFFVFG